MRLQLQTCLFVAVGCLFAFQSQAQAQFASFDQAAAVAPGFVQGGPAFVHEAPAFAQGGPAFAQGAACYAEPAGGCGCKKGGCGCKKGGGHRKGGGCGCKGGGGHKLGGGCGCRGGIDESCKPTGPTVPGELPLLPIRTACDSPWGKDNIPSLFTPPRSYIPPIGKDVGRPLFGRWTGY